MFELEKYDKKDPFGIPNNYFEDLPMRIQKRIQGQPKGYSVANWWTLPQILWSMAGSFVVALAVMAFFWKPWQSSEQKADIYLAKILSEISQQEIIEYVAQNELHHNNNWVTDTKIAEKHLSEIIESSQNIESREVIINKNKTIKTEIPNQTLPSIEKIKVNKEVIEKELSDEELEQLLEENAI
jgi:hypothetical protein